MMSHGCRIRMSRLLSCFGIKYNSLCFIPRDKRPTNIISQAIKKKFDGAWPKFSHVPSNVRQIWWDNFKSHWSISKDNEGLVRSLFEKRCGERLKDMLFTVRTCYATMEKIPAWILVTVFEKLFEYWESEDFMKASTANKSNRNRISDEGLPVGRGERESNGRTICNAGGDSKDCTASPRIPPYSRWCLIVRIMDCSYFAMYCVVTLFCFGNPKWNNISFCNLLISYMEPLLTWFG